MFLKILPRILFWIFEWFFKRLFYLILKCLNFKVYYNKYVFIVWILPKRYDEIHIDYEIFTIQLKFYNFEEWIALTSILLKIY